MTDDERKLLEEYGVLILPDEIEHDTFVLLLKATLYRPSEPITLYCHGEGGDSCATGAMVDIIQRHGNVIGILAGEANSSHGVVFAACSKRYVHPGGRLGVHRVARPELHHITADYAMAHYQDLESHDRRNAEIYASACTGSFVWPNFWFDMIRENTRALKHLDAAYLIETGMARPIAEMGKD